MTGFHVTAYRQQNEGSSPALAGMLPGEVLAVWQTSSNGLEWLDELVRHGQAMNLGGNGYPSEYTAMARRIIPRLREGPPEARAVWICGADDIITPQWHGKTVRFERTMDACRSCEWLIIHAWDVS